MRNLLLLITLILSGSILLAQEQQDSQQSIYPERVVKAVYFDKSPALRDVEPIIPGVRKRSWPKDEVTNPSVSQPPFVNRENENPDFNDQALQKEVFINEEYWPLRNIMAIGNVNGVYPPDTDGDVGLNHYFMMVNCSFAIYDKSGVKLYGPADNSTLWDGFEGPWSNTNDGDPIVLYDEVADRWFASQFAISTSNGTYWQLVAISATADPLGEYYRYAFQFSKFNDYPKFGVWNNAYLGTFNFFNGGGSSYAGAGAVVLERDAMLAGDPDAQMIQFSINGAKFGILPADFDGTPPPATEPAWFAHINNTGSKTLEIWKATINWASPSSSTYTLANNLTVTTFNASVSSIPQPNTTQTLDALSGHLMYRLQYRNFGSYSTLVTNHTVTANARASIRWYELRKTANDWTVHQQGTFSPDTDHRWMGSIAMNGNGNIALGYGVSSSSTFPSIRYTGRTANAPLNTFNMPECSIVEGASSQTNINRWGDYSSMSIDPADDSTFWYAHMYRLSTNWRTQFASFNFAPGVGPEVDAGPDEWMCADENTITTKASAVAITTVLWTTTGDGMLLYTNRLETLYAPGANDRSSGSVTLTCQVTGWNGEVVSDQMQIHINQDPQAFAGNDTLICYNETLQLHGTSTFAESTLWQTAGDGSFNDPANPNAIYTPGSQDISTGSVQLTFNAYATEVCTGQDSDVMNLTVDVCNAIDENTDLKVVSINPNPGNGLITLSVLNKNREKIKWELSNINGEIIRNFSLKANTGNYNEQIDFTTLASGTYVMKVIVGKKVYTERLMINK